MTRGIIYGPHLPQSSIPDIANVSKKTAYASIRDVEQVLHGVEKCLPEGGSDSEPQISAPKEPTPTKEDEVEQRREIIDEGCTRSLATRSPFAQCSVT